MSGLEDGDTITFGEFSTDKKLLSKDKVFFKERATFTKKHNERLIGWNPLWLYYKVDIQ